jgi:uncharacterized membrane protein
MADVPTEPVTPHKPTWWEKVKEAASKNRVIAGALAGLAAGTVLPGLGNLTGAVGGAIIGWWSGKEQERHEAKE